MATKIIESKKVTLDALKDAADKSANSFPFSGGETVATVAKATAAKPCNPEIICDTLDFGGRKAESFSILIGETKVPLSLFKNKQAVDARGDVQELQGTFGKTARLDDIYLALQERAQKSAFDIVCNEMQIIYKNADGRDYISRLVSLTLRDK